MATTEQLEERFRRAEGHRLASERQVEANIGIKESLESMEQALKAMERSIDGLTLKLTTFMEQQARVLALETETLGKLNKYMDDWL